MSRKANALTVRYSQDDVDRNLYETSQRARERGTAGQPRRLHDVPAHPYRIGTCPACGLRIQDQVVAQLGFCDRCREFTGMCGAGRRVICPDVMTRTTWHTPCTQLGTVAWEITHGQGQCRTVLCRVHDTQVRFGGIPHRASRDADDDRCRQGAEQATVAYPCCGSIEASNWEATTASVTRTLRLRAH
jgi:hypothetical protein